MGVSWPRGCWNLEDTEAISLCCPALTHANFDYCPFTEVALANFVNSQGAKLKELSIWWTVQPTYPSAVSCVVCRVVGRVLRAVMRVCVC